MTPKTGGKARSGFRSRKPLRSPDFTFRARFNDQESLPRPAKQLCPVGLHQ